MGEHDVGHIHDRLRRSRRWTILAWAIAVVALVVMAPVTGGAPAAEAVSPGSHVNNVVNPDPINNTPHVLNGYVRSFAEVGNTVVVGGNFTQTRTAASPTVISRTHLMAFNKTTGAILPLNPSLNGEVYSVLPTGDGRTVWIAGGFSSLNGQTVRSLAKIDVTTANGQRDTSFNPPAFNGRIHEIMLRNGRLYVAGRFTTVGSDAHTLLAALNPSTGALIPEVEMTFSDPRNGGTLTILSADATPDGSKLVVIGNFTSINGAARYQIAVIDLTTPTPTLANWATNRYGNGCSSSFQTYMRDIEIDPTGTYFVVVTTGAYNTTFLCDTASRWDLASTGSTVEPTWTNYTGGDTLTAAGVTETAVYVGGHNGWFNNPYAGDRIGNGAVVVEGLAALDPRSGAILNWFPERTLGVGVYGFSAVDDGLWIGSDTDRIGNSEFHGRLAFMPLSGGHSLPAEHTGSVPGQTVTITTTDVITRNVTATSVTTVRTTSAADWTGLRGAFMISGKLYTGWSDRTFKVQDYDGVTFGPRTTIPLQRITAAHPGGPGDPATSINRFSTEDLATITAMFYDQTTGRIYFTKSGQSRLFYRSFSIDTNIVGAHRQDGPANLAGLDWRNVRGMFLSGNSLYVADNTGRLTRWNWTPNGGPADPRNLSPAAYSGTPVVGTGAVVSGPTVDGQSWNGLDTFLFAEADGPPNQLPTAVANADCTNNSCTFRATGSTDPDGTITSYSWNFGDGSAPGTGFEAPHVYTADGEFTVTLTVVDNRGGSAVDTTTVDITVPNQPPTASFTANCSGLTCNFVSNSTDPDGTITSYSWSFGDGDTSTEASPPHTYDAPGTYSVSLTVTDNDGAPATTSRQVAVSDTPGGVVTFRAVASTNVNSTTPRVVVPASVAPGDVMVMFATLNTQTPTITAPAGWTELDRVSSATVTGQTVAWWRTATASDLGAAVGPNFSGFAKVALQLVAYSQAAAVTASQVAVEGAVVAAHTTPTVPVASAGSLLVSYWADKSSATTTITVPGTSALRNMSSGTGGGHITAAVADNGSLAAGTAGGITATADTANRQAVMWSVVISPS